MSSSPDINIVKPKRGRRSKKTIQEENEKKLLESSNTIIQKTNEITEIYEEVNTNLEEIKDINGEGEGGGGGGGEGGIETNDTIIEDMDDLKEEKQTNKKRGRKPKGGKIVKQTTALNVQKENRPNIILHLKCSLKDLDGTGDYNSNFTSNNIDPYNFKSDLSYEMLNEPEHVYNPSIHMNPTYITQTIKEPSKNTSEYETEISVNNSDSREIWRKLKVLEQNLHLNNISDKKSACFWCTYDFDNPPIYIPKHFIKDSYHVYGCFCSPECAVAHLMEENIDSSAKFERYHLINHIYSKIYEYKKNIKPAPHPNYMLEKYYGNLTIQEYRSLLKSERLFLIVDKPLTRILPEFHEDNDEFIINNKIIPSSNNYHVKKKIVKNVPQTKNNIVNEKFGLAAS